MRLSGCAMETTVALLLETVSQLTGLSESRLRRWDNTGFFTPSYAMPNRRRPHSRIYSLEDFIALQAIVKLMELGVSHQRLRDVVPALKSVPADEWAHRKLYVVQGEVFLDEASATQARRAHGDADIVTIDMESLVADVRQQLRRRSERTPDQIGRVIRDRWTMGGVPIIAGTRIPTATIYDYVQHGETAAQIIEAYPRLTEEDVTAAVAFESDRRRKSNTIRATG